MFHEVGLLDLFAGGLIMLGIVAAFMVWLIFPILPFLLVGAVYALLRYGLTAVECAALSGAHATVEAIRRAATPLALWGS